MFEKKQSQDEQNRPLGGVILTLCRLLLVLFVQILKWTLRIIIKLVKWEIKMIKMGWKELNLWWNDNSTQEKVAKIKSGIKKGAITFGHWMVIAAKCLLKWTIKGCIALWKGLKTGIKATIQGIIHLKPTIIKLGELIVLGWKATLRWFRRCGRGVKLSHIRNKRRYHQFRKNKGFKGLLIDCSRAVKNSISTFMEEDQEEATPDAVTEDDIIEEEIENHIKEENKARKIGNAIFTKAKEVVDIN